MHPITIKCHQCGKEIRNLLVDFKCPHCGCEYKWDSCKIICTAYPNDNQHEISKVNILENIKNLNAIAETYLKIRESLLPIGKLYEWQGRYCHGSFVESTMKWFITLEREHFIIEFDIEDSDDSSLDHIRVVVPIEFIEDTKDISAQIINYANIIKYVTFEREKEKEIEVIKFEIERLEKPIKNISDSIKEIEKATDQLKNDNKFTEEYKATEIAKNQKEIQLRQAKLESKEIQTTKATIQRLKCKITVIQNRRISP